MLIGKGILHGLRVIDSGTFIAGPIVGMYLASYGAEVNKKWHIYIYAYIHALIYIYIYILKINSLPL